MLAVKTLGNDNSPIFRRSARLMGSQFEISVVADNAAWADERINAAIHEINRIEKLLSIFDPKSKINEINRNAGVQPVKVSGEIFRLIDRSLQIAELTHGAFDIVYAASNDSNNYTDNTGTTMHAVSTASYKNVVLDANATTVFLKEKNMRIGFGANSKGYAADRAKYILQTLGVSSGVINAAGDLLTWGLQPDNTSWTIGAADPEQASQQYANVEISNLAIATSVNADSYANISAKIPADKLNAQNGFSVSGIKSVSMISPSAELADAMATPIMAIGINAGLYMINQLNQMACIIIDDHNRSYTSKDITL